MVRICLAASLLLTLFSLSPAQTPDKKLVVICSTTQVADLARQVIGDRWEVQCVLGAEEDPHTYEVGADDNAAVSRADLCLENGWNLEGNQWMRRMAENANKPIVTCVEGVTPIQLDEHGQTVMDPHAWFDPANAWIYVKNIRDAVSKLDPPHASEYAARAELYKFQLEALNRWIQQQVNQIPKNRRVLVTHHDAFGYFCKKYGFRPASPIGWTTAELVDVSLEQRQEVVRKIRETGVKAIFVETSLNKELLVQIADEAGVAIGGRLYSDAMGSAESAGATYIGMMRENVLIIVNNLK
jgi:manganese/iron transport system substrate-binding protein